MTFMVSYQNEQSPQKRFEINQLFFSIQIKSYVVIELLS